MSLVALKTSIEKAIKIADWSPTDDELILIAHELSTLCPTDLTESRLYEVLNRTQQRKFVRILNEGEDNTDLNVLLLLCLQAARNVKK